MLSMMGPVGPHIQTNQNFYKEFEEYKPKTGIGLEVVPARSSTTGFMPDFKLTKGISEESNF